MKPDRPEPADPQSAGRHEMAPLLSAYLDGRLDPAERGPVEAWLDRHPGARVEMDEIGRFMGLWPATSPPEPDLATWEELRRRIETRVFHPDRGDRRPTPAKPGLKAKGRPLWVLSLASAAAAAAVLAVTAAWPDRPPSPRDDGVVAGPPALAAGPTPGQADEPGGEPFPVMELYEVNIISMDAGDADALALGEDPMLGDIELTRSKDFTLIQVGPGQEDGPAARLQRGHFPMIVPVLASAQEQ